MSILKGSGELVEVPRRLSGLQPPTVVRRPPGNQPRLFCSPTWAAPLTSSFTFSATVAPAPTPLGCSRPTTGPGPSHLHARLMLLKHTAEQVSLLSRPPALGPGLLVGGRKEHALAPGGCGAPTPPQNNSADCLVSISETRTSGLVLWDITGIHHLC